MQVVALRDSAAMCWENRCRSICNTHSQYWYYRVWQKNNDT